MHVGMPVSRTITHVTELELKQNMGYFVFSAEPALKEIREEASRDPKHGFVLNPLPTVTPSRYYQKQF